MHEYFRLSRLASALAVGAVLSACASTGFSAPLLSHSAPVGERLDDPPAAAPAVAAHPADARIEDERAARIRDSALKASGQRIVVSLDEKTLWLMRGEEIAFTAPIAIGAGYTFTWGDRSWTFNTPTGQRRVIAKEKDPLWRAPDWHYLRKAASRGLEPVRIQPGEKYELSDGSYLEMRDGNVGRVNQYGNFWAIRPGIEIIFDNKIFIPPFGTPQRMIPDVLGTRKLDTGDAIYIHGTYDNLSIGTAASAGCIRMYNQDVEKLYDMVPVGTPVFIY